MKNLILFACLCILSTAIQAQEQYKPCLDEGMVKWSLLDNNAPDIDWASTDVIVFGDTLINGNRYKKIYTVWDDYDRLVDNEGWKNYYPDLLNDPWINHCEYAYIRESADASQLYLYNAWAEKEYLMSDISLQEGDTLFGYGEYKKDYIVDSVYVKNDLKHIRLFSDYDDYGPISFIEGVGPNIWGISYYFIRGSGGRGYVNCFQNQTRFYKNDDYIFYFDFGKCYCGYQSPLDLHSIETENYRLFIQDEKIEMIFPVHEKREIRLYNLYGRLLWEQTSDHQSLSIPVSGYGKGVYIIQIANRQGKRIGAEKIIL